MTIIGGDKSHRIRGIATLREAKALISANKSIIDKVSQMVGMAAQFR